MFSLSHSKSYATFSLRSQRLLLILVLLLGISSVYSLTAKRAFAHGDHGHAGSQELLEIYQTLFQGLETSKASPSASIPLVHYGQQPFSTNLDAVGLLLQRLLTAEGLAAAEHAACHSDHGTEQEHIFAALEQNSSLLIQRPRSHSCTCSHDHHDHGSAELSKNAVVRAAQKAALAVGGWFKMVPGFMTLELPAMMIDGFRQYGVSFMVYTGATELVEHIGLGIGGPAFCKLLQAIYVSTAGVVFNYCRIATSSLSDDGIASRAQAAFLAARQEVLFKYGSYGKKVSRSELYLTELKRGSFRKAMEQLGEDSKFLRDYLTASEFWGDVFANVGFEKTQSASQGDLFEVKATQGTIGAQVDAVFDETTEKGKLWRAQRLAAFLGTFADLLREASGGVANDAIFSEESLWNFHFTPYKYLKESAQSYWKYMRVRWMLGAVSKIIDRYKSALFAAAVSEKMNHRELKKSAYRDFLENDILPLLGALSQAGSVDLDSDQLSALEKKVKLTLKQQSSLLKADWDFVARCNAYLAKKPAT